MNTVVRYMYNDFIVYLVELLVSFTPSPNISVGQEAVFNCYNEVYLESVILFI